MNKQFDVLNETNSTVIEWEGKELKTTDDPHVVQLSNVLYEKEMYNAPAIDEQGNEYVVYWAITNNETTDESEACDWDNPLKVTKL